MKLWHLCLTPTHLWYMSQFLLQKKLCFETGTHPPFGPMSQNTQFFFLKASLREDFKKRMEFFILSKTHPPQLPGMKTEYNKTNSLPDASIKCVQSFQVVLRFYCVQSVQCVLTDWLMLLSLMLISLMLYIQYVFNVYSMCIQYPIYLHSLFYYIFIVCLNGYLLPLITPF